MTFLGYRILGSGITPDPELVQRVMDLQTPTNRRLEILFGLGNFFRWFIHKYSEIMEPLNRQLKQNTPFTWTSEQDQAFEKLKLALST